MKKKIKFNPSFNFFLTKCLNGFHFFFFIYICKSLIYNAENKIKTAFPLIVNKKRNYHAEKCICT